MTKNTLAPIKVISIMNTNRNGSIVSTASPTNLFRSCLQISSSPSNSSINLCKAVLQLSSVVFSSIIWRYLSQYNMCIYALSCNVNSTMESILALLGLYLHFPPLFLVLLFLPQILWSLFPAIISYLLLQCVSFQTFEMKKIMTVTVIMIWIKTLNSIDLQICKMSLPVEYFVAV